MRSFDNIAHLIKQSRLKHPNAYSQSELSSLLGYKNGQFISNVERALCNVPLKMLVKMSEVLDIPKEEIKRAILKDHSVTLDNYLETTDSADVQELFDPTKEDNQISTPSEFVQSIGLKASNG